MKLRYLTLIITGLLLLTSCAPVQPSVQSLAVYLYNNSSEAEDIFTKDVKVFDRLEKNLHLSEIIPWQISLPLEDDTVVLHYNSDPKMPYRYYSENEDIKCSLNLQTGEIVSLSIANPVALSGFSYENQEAFIKSVKQLISAYTNVDYTEYAISCTTRKTITGNNAAWAETFDGFHLAENENEEVTQYTINFSKQINGINTSDGISATYYLKNYPTDSLVLFFSLHKFDAVKAIDLDMEKTNASIDAFLHQHLNSKEYALIDYEILNPLIVRINDQLYYKCRISLDLKTKQGEIKDMHSLIDVITETGIDVSYAPVGAPSIPYQVLAAEKPADYVGSTEPVESAAAGAPTGSKS